MSQIPRVPQGISSGRAPRSRPAGLFPFALLLILGLAFFATSVTARQEGAPAPGDASAASTPDTPAEATGSPAGSSPEGPAAPSHTETIPATEISGRAEEMAARSRQIRATLSSEDEKDELQSAESELDAAFRDIREVQDDPAFGELTHWTLSDLENLRLDWTRRKDRIDSLRERLESRAKRVQGQLEEIGESEQLWDRTVRSLIDEAVPAALVERARSTRTDLRETREALEKRSTRILTLLDRVSASAITAGDIIATVDLAYSEAGKRLLSSDSPPLWDLMTMDAGEMSMRSQAGEALRRNATEWLDYLSGQTGRLVFHAGLFAFLLFLMRSTRRRALDDSGRTGSGGPGGSGVFGASGGQGVSGPTGRTDPSRSLDARILSRPFSAALLVSLIATLFIYPDAPIAHYRISLIVAVVPLLRLLHCVVQRRLILPIYGLTGLYFLDLLSDLTVPRSTLQRLLLLATSALGLAGLAITMRPRGPITHTDGESRWWKVSLLLARVGGFSLALALLANVLGRVALAEILTDGPIKSAYVALLFFAGYLVLSALAALAMKTDVARRSRIVMHHSALLLHNTRLVLRLAGLLIWLMLALAIFRLYGAVIGGLGRALSYELHIGDLVVTPAHVLTFIATIVVSVWLSRFIRFVLEEDILSRVELPRGVPGTLSMLVRYGVIALGFLIAVRSAGVELSQVTILAGALGVGIGFGLQNVVNNFISGLILAFERPVQVGDTIEFGGLMGRVQEIGIRSSIIRTFQGAEVIVPNGNLISNEVTNWTLADRNRRIEIRVGVAYGSNPHRVIELLSGVAREHSEILSTPEPDALFKGFGDSSLDFLLRCWTGNSEAFLKIESELVLAVHDALYREGIEIPFPQRDLHLRSLDDETRELLGGRKTGARGRKGTGPSGVSEGETGGPSVRDEGPVGERGRGGAGEHDVSDAGSQGAARTGGT